MDEKVANAITGHTCYIGKPGANMNVRVYLLTYIFMLLLFQMTICSCAAYMCNDKLYDVGLTELESKGIGQRDENQSGG
jgi:hypothetical protein